MTADVPPPSDEGLARAELVVNEFADELLAEAGRLASRRKADQASAAHVDEAASWLYSRTVRRTRQALGTAGGVTAGIGGSSMVSFLAASDPNVTLIAGSAAVMGIGIAALVYGLTDGT
jgi:hypothetical protein